MHTNVEAVKESAVTMKTIFSGNEIYERGETILLLKWNNWNEE